MPAVDRTKQRLAEKFNRTTSSKYPAEFEQACRVMEGAGEGTKDLVDRLRKHLKCLEGSGKLLLVEQLGEAAEHLASGLSSNSVYAQSLHNVAKTEKALGTLERAYSKDVEERVIAALEGWHDGNFKTFKKERATLEKQRLEMDRAILKAREKGDDNPELKVAEEARTRDHNAQMSLVQGLLDALPKELDTHKNAVSAFLKLQHRLHSDSLRELDALLKIISARIGTK